MKKLFVSQSLVEIEVLKELLEKVDILCTIKNQQGSSLAGEVPFVEVFPELWIVTDDDLDRAKEVLKERAKVVEAGKAAWVCSGCGERHDGNFTACWKCGQERNPEDHAADV